MRENVLRSNSWQILRTYNRDNKCQCWRLCTEILSSRLPSSERPKVLIAFSKVQEEEEEEETAQLGKEEEEEKRESSEDESSLAYRDASR